MNTPNEFLKDLRLKRGITQRQLAEAIGYTSPQYVSIWERNQVPIPLMKVKDIIKALKMSKEEVLTLKERVELESEKQIEKYFPLSKKTILRKKRLQ